LPVAFRQFCVAKLLLPKLCPEKRDKSVLAVLAKFTVIGIILAESD